MTDGHLAPSPPEPERVATATTWAMLFEELLRGLVHGLNNRITALSAFAELAAMDDEPLELDRVRLEITRLHGVSSLVGMLVSRGRDVEALELRPVLEQALSIHGHNALMGGAACVIEQAGFLLPVRVPRWALLRLFLLLVDAAKRTAGAQESPATVGLSGDQAAVRAHILSSEPISEDAIDLAAACGGTILRDGDGITLELPSLLELRHRERAVR